MGEFLKALLKTFLKALLAYQACVGHFVFTVTPAQGGVIGEAGSLARELKAV